MNESEIVERMIAFIEEKENQLQIHKMLPDSQTKNDMVKSILDELERMTADED